MSICPDKIVFSEYFDDELPSPWNKKVEKLVNTCEDCKDVLKEYSDIREAMHSDFKVCDDFNYDESYEKLKVRFNHAKLQKRKTNMGFWAKSVRLPMGAVAAVVFAFVFLPVLLLLSNIKMNTKAQDLPIAYDRYYDNFTFPSNTVQNVSTNTPFSSSINSFMKMYMPSAMNSKDVIIIRIPSFEFENSDGFITSSEDDVLTTKQSNE